MYSFVREQPNNFSLKYLVSNKTQTINSENETLFIEFTKVSGGCSKDNLQVLDGSSLQSPLLSSYQ